MSAADTNKLRARVATLDKLLDDFDDQLDDLLDKSLPETLLGLDTIQQAKLQVTIPYLVYDLVIIYLKTKGIDPRTHPVFRELERVKGYIGKVSKAEKQESEQQRMAIDKAAASRFIKHAIAQATQAQDQSSTEPGDRGPTPGPSRIPAQPIPAGATTKMLARAEWEKEVKEAAEEDEEDLEVFEETEGGANANADDRTSAHTSLPVDTGETTLPEQQSATAKKKTRRSNRARLPLTGAGGTEFSTTSLFVSQPEIHTPTGPTHEDASSEKVNSKKRPFPPSETPIGDSEDPGVPASASASKNKRRRRNRRNQNAQVVATGGETDGTTSRSQSQSQSQSRDVSVTSTPQVLTQSLPGVERDVTAAGAGEKPRKWRKYNRKKKNANTGQPAEEPGTQS